VERFTRRGEWLPHKEKSLRNMVKLFPQQMATSGLKVATVGRSEKLFKRVSVSANFKFKGVALYPKIT
jgi:hypothetical protein